MSHFASVLLLLAAAVPAAACASQARRGQQLYAERGCAVCHGPGGRGDGPSAKRLDLPPRDFANVRAYRQGSARSDVVASIRRGTPGGAMPAFRDLSDAEAEDIAAWIVSLQQPGSGGQP
jgi:mono/diheme cytochrome c family protein